jgi:hypothetical protein
MKIKWKGVDYDIAAERIKVWQHEGKWRGMIEHSDGSDGISTDLMGAATEQQASVILKRMANEWLEEDVTPEDLGLT